MILEKSNKIKKCENFRIDYWEISEEKLTIKTERLGHGAYGQVYKGRKLVG